MKLILRSKEMVVINKVSVPYFHSIHDGFRQDWIRNYLTIEMKTFEKFLVHLKRNKWETITLDEMHDLRKKTTRVKGKFCVITFDDGYVDNYIYAYPLLKKYGMKGTIFVSPECIDEKRIKAKNLFDFWQGNIKLESLSVMGYLNWEEMKEMQDSGVIDIQSHTMTHTKYNCSSNIVAFHSPGYDSLYEITNRYPDMRAYYFNDPNFERLIPYGTPIFEQKSSVITRIHVVNQEFEKEVVSSLSKYSMEKLQDAKRCFDAIKPIYERYLKNDELFSSIESEKEYKQRVMYEIRNSKQILETKLNKPVNFLCWPHGDNNEYTHSIAMDCNYLATTMGNATVECDKSRFSRFGVAGKGWKKYMWEFKLNMSIDKQPYVFAANIWRILSNYKNSV